MEISPKEQAPGTRYYNLTDTCYFCTNLAEYWDSIDYEIISVCKNHILKYGVS